jgi:hypothetical protein
MTGRTAAHPRGVPRVPPRYCAGQMRWDRFRMFAELRKAHRSEGWDGGAEGLSQSAQPGAQATSTTFDAGDGTPAAGSGNPAGGSEQILHKLSGQPTSAMRTMLTPAPRSAHHPEVRRAPARADERQLCCDDRTCGRVIGYSRRSLFLVPARRSTRSALPAGDASGPSAFCGCLVW